MEEVVAFRIKWQTVSKVGVSLEELVDSSRKYTPFFEKIRVGASCTLYLGTSAFKSFDKDKSGQIDASEFKQVCKSMGHSDVSDAQIAELFKKIDKNKDSKIDWEEFLKLMVTVVKMQSATFGAVM